VILAIPDKRYCFDYLRQTTRLSELVDAWLRRNRRPMSAQLFDYNANAVDVDVAAAWAGPLDPSSLQRYVTPRAALDFSIQSARHGVYVDAHCWVFTPASLLGLLSDMVELDLLQYHCVRFHETERNANEMILVLERNGEAAGSDLQTAAARESFLVHLRQLDPETMLLTNSGGGTGDGTKALCDQNRALRATVASMQAALLKVPALQEKLEAVQAEVDALRGSTSWKVTEPLRRVRQWTRALQSRASA